MCVSVSLILMCVYRLDFYVCLSHICAALHVLCNLVYRKHATAKHMVNFPSRSYH